MFHETSLFRGLMGRAIQTRVRQRYHGGASMPCVFVLRRTSHILLGSNGKAFFLYPHKVCLLPAEVHEGLRKESPLFYSTAH